ncbi:MAG: hypothetical protein ACLQVX_17880 [Limisphaerales bacterium]
MNDGNVDMKDLDPPECEEVLEARTLGWIETLRRKRVCLFPGGDLPLHDQRTDADFARCLPFIGDCNALIFCEPHRSKNEVLGDIVQYAGGEGGVFNDDPFDRGASLGIKKDLIEQDGLWFPNGHEDLLVWRPQLHADPVPSRPPESRFWAHYAILKPEGRAEKIHLLHLGLRGDHAWVYFIQPLGIRVARLISHAFYPQPPWRMNQ